MLRWAAPGAALGGAGRRAGRTVDCVLELTAAKASSC